jgi:hypothetical protein
MQSGNAKYKVSTFSAVNELRIVLCCTQVKNTQREREREREIRVRCVKDKASKTAAVVAARSRMKSDRRDKRQIAFSISG